MFLSFLQLYTRGFLTASLCFTHHWILARSTILSTYKMLNSEAGTNTHIMKKLECLSETAKPKHRRLSKMLHQQMCTCLHFPLVWTAQLFQMSTIVQNLKVTALLDQGRGKIPDIWDSLWDIWFVHLPKIQILQLVHRQTQLVSATMKLGGTMTQSNPYHQYTQQSTVVRLISSGGQEIASAKKPN